MPVRRPEAPDHGATPAGAPVRAVVFDLFDTLVDLDFSHLPTVEAGGRRVHSTYPLLHAALPDGARERVPYDAFAAALREVDREIADGPHRRCEEVSTLERFARLARRLGLDDASAAGLRRVHMAGIRSGATAPREHAAVLRWLRERFAIGVCSNFTDAATAREILAACGLAAHVDAIAISEGVGWRKPRPEPFLDVLGRLGVAPEAALHVGDQLVDDVLGATRVGMRSAWAVRRVRDPEARRSAHPEARPTWVVRDLAELLGLLGDRGR
jgi:FMN phosphatase YigB (HAD superfamily)